MKEYQLNAHFEKPNLRIRENLYFIDNQYRKFPHNIRIWADGVTILESSNMATKGHDLVHILSGFYLDQLLGRQRTELSPMQEMLDIGFGAGCITSSKKDYPDLFNPKNAKKWLYYNIFRPILLLEEKKSAINYRTSESINIKEFEKNSQLVENLQKLAIAALDLGVIFRNENKQQARYMNLIYFQFSQWKDRVKDNIREFNKKKYKSEDEFEKYLQENKDDFTFTIEISSLETNIDLSPYNIKITEIINLISQIGNFEFSFNKKTN